MSARINKIIQEMETSATNPIDHYIQALTTTPTSFTFRKVSMHELRKTLSQMKPTGSMGYDDIAMRNIKHAQLELEPLLLLLVNRCIIMTTFPDCLKLSKVVPIEKKGKD